MNLTDLSVTLRESARLLQEGLLGELDPSDLARNLTAAAELLVAAKDDRNIAGRMLEQFRDELRRRARAVAKLSGGDSALIERLIDGAETSFDDLVKLGKQLSADFDRAFSASLAEADKPPHPDEQLAAFKS